MSEHLITDASPAQRTGARSRYRDQMRAEIVRYTPTARDDVVAFRRAMYGNDAAMADASYVRWRYEDPECTTDDRTPLWLYHKGGQLHAHMGGLRTALKVGEHEHAGLWLFDLMVSPRFRMRGVGVLLAEIAADVCPITLGMEVSDAAKAPLLRAGWSDLGIVPLYVRPLDLPALLRQHGRNGVWSQAGRVGNLGLAALDRVGAWRAARNTLHMIEVAQFDERVDEVWRSAASSYPVLCCRDQHTLNWRFARFPDPARYRRFVFTCGDAAIGYAVLRMGEHHGLRAGSIVDFLCAPRWTAALLARCVAVFRRHDMQIVYCLHRNPVADSAFTALGFVRRSSMWPFLLHAPNLPPEQRALVCDPNSWFITAGDSDVDRPREGTVFANDLAAGQR